MLRMMLTNRYRRVPLIAVLVMAIALSRCGRGVRKLAQGFLAERFDAMLVRLGIRNWDEIHAEREDERIDN